MADDFRLVALDLRGHGLSDKPHDDYADCLLWADDIRAVIQQMRLEQPVLCGWSYGAIVILDYLRKYGESEIAGISFVDAITRLGTEAALAALTPELLSLVPCLFAAEVEDSVSCLDSFLRLCSANPPAEDDLYLMLGYNLAVPPHIRQALFSRSFDNEDLLPRLRKPAMIAHGTEDAIVKPSAIADHQAGLRHAEVHMLAGAGHASFWDKAAEFNQLLRNFCNRL